MKILKGKPISPGYAEGDAFVYSKKHEPETPHYKISPDDISTEHRRLHRALEQSVRELKNVEKKVMSELGQAESQVFAAHLTLLKDPKFISKVKERIQRDLVNVEHAIDWEIQDFADLLSEFENEYLRERADDVKDIGRRVLKHLGDDYEELLYSIPEGSVIVAKELLPSDTIHMDRAHVAAVVTERGGESSHVAILTRSLNIPAVSGISDVSSLIPNEAKLLVNGEKGTVTLSASQSSLESFQISKNRYNHVSTVTAEKEEEKCATVDGVDVKLMANIGRVEEAEQVLGHHLDGVGLYRTEFLYLRSAEVPSRDSQLKAYTEVAEKLDDLPVVIRTLDLGGDKKPHFVDAGFENNPNLGSRGLRFSLSESGLLDTQLDAIAASHETHTNIRVLFPMVLGEDDLRQSVEKLRKIADERSIRQTPDVGAMIETPSALFELNEILEEADFISIGTNDLAQFMLAADRNTLGLVEGDPAIYPSMLRAIKKVVDAAKKKKRPVCICGEAAGDPVIACLFVGLGVRELSMSPVRAARVRYAIRKTNSGELEELASKALQCGNLEEIQYLLLEFENTMQISTAETQISGQKISKKHLQILKTDETNLRL